MSRKTEADHISLLLSILEHTDSKTDWNEVAKVTGLYKEGKFVRQAFNSIKTKYGTAAPSAINGAKDDTPSKNTKKQPKSKAISKKRGKKDENGIPPAKKSKTDTDRGDDEDKLSQHLDVD